MAKQSGVIKFTGQLGGISGYKDGNGNHLMRTKGGASKEQIANGENFARTRENNAEFGGIAKVGKVIRDAFASTKRSWGRYVTGRLVQILKSINLLDDTEKRGQRGILITTAPEKLNGFQFNKNSNVDSVIRAPFSVTANADRNEATFAVPAVSPGITLNSPTGATHARYICAAMGMSDWVYNPDTSEYEPSTDVTGEIVVAHSAYLDLSADVAATSVVATLPGGVALDAAASLITIVGIQYYQEIGGEYYPFSQNDAIKIGLVV